MAPEFWPEVDPRDSAHRNISSYVQFLAQHLLDLNKEKTRKIVRTFFDYLYWSSFFNSSLDVCVGKIKNKNVFYATVKTSKSIGKYSILLLKLVSESVSEKLKHIFCT